MTDWIAWRNYVVAPSQKSSLQSLSCFRSCWEPSAPVGQCCFRPIRDRFLHMIERIRTRGQSVWRPSSSPSSVRLRRIRGLLGLHSSGRDTSRHASLCTLLQLHGLSGLGEVLTHREPHKRLALAGAYGPDWRPLSLLNPLTEPSMYHNDISPVVVVRLFLPSYETGGQSDSKMETITWR